MIQIVWINSVTLSVRHIALYIWLWSQFIVFKKYRKSFLSSLFSLFLSLSVTLFIFSQIFSSYKQLLILSSIILKHRDCILQSLKKLFSYLVFFFFHYSSLLTQFLSLITYHSSLKILQFLIPTCLAHFTQLVITQIFQFFVDPMPVTWLEQSC